MGVKDKQGKEWPLNQAIVRILFEKYPNPTNLSHLEILLPLHPSFIKKALESLEKDKVILRKGDGFSLTRNKTARDQVNQIMEKVGEAKKVDGIYFIQVSTPKPIFVNCPTFSYFNHSLL